NAVGFRHVRPDDIYVAALRAAKYGVLLTALTFLACFVLERFGRERLHPAQYGLIGLSLALFYVLLTALAERIGLLPAYAAAAGAIVLMNGGYVAAALRSARRGLGAGTALACLYVAFYVMLASEDDELLIGAGLLLAGLALAMAATARINRRADVSDDGGGAPQPVRG
ncbi:MAG: inner membrane CreD family protein, partial [Alphaproteobacteria bacterium]